MNHQVASADKSPAQQHNDLISDIFWKTITRNERKNRRDKRRRRLRRFRQTSKTSWESLFASSIRRSDRPRASGSEDYPSRRKSTSCYVKARAKLIGVRRQEKRRLLKESRRIPARHSLTKNSLVIPSGIAPSKYQDAKKLKLPARMRKMEARQRRGQTRTMSLSYLESLLVDLALSFEDRVLRINDTQ